MTTEWTTRWEGKSIVPVNYDDLPALVKLARKARELPVAFNWILTEVGLEGLRRAVYEWGTRAPGRYRLFDSRMLDAVNGALNDPHSLYILSKPTRTGPVVAEVSCVAEGAVFHVRGRATFDLIFLYASSGLNSTVPGAAHLGEAAPVLAQSADGLGWDIAVLQEERYRGVRSALYGMSASYGVPVGLRSSEPPLELKLHFHGPFTAVEGADVPCVFTSPMGLKSGVYLWTINVDGVERPWYVGQTRRSFNGRFVEHVRGFLSGEYATYDADALSRGEFRRVAGHEGVWPQNLPTLISNFEKVGPGIARLLRQIRFHVAPLEQAHDRVEGAIGRHYRREHKGFMMPGLQVPGVAPYDRRLHLVISSETALEGMPAEIRD